MRFLDDPTELIGVEAAGEGIESGRHGASLSAGSTGVLHGAMSAVLADEQGQILEAHSVSAGLDYPGVGPEHAHLRDTGRARYVAVTDDDAVRAFRELARLEGIIPALEPSHAIAWLLADDSTLRRLRRPLPLGPRRQGHGGGHGQARGARGPRCLRATRVAGAERIAGAFSAARDEGRAALMPYLMGGFPDAAGGVAVAEAYADAGADLIELGIPFSDPLADGPVIHAAATAALEAGATVDTALEACSAVAERVPVVAMVYSNMILAGGGAEAFAGTHRGCGRGGGDRPGPAARGGGRHPGRPRGAGPRARPARRTDHAARAPTRDLRGRRGLRLPRLDGRRYRRARGAAARADRPDRAGEGGGRRARRCRIRDRDAGAGRRGRRHGRRGDHRDAARPRGRRRARRRGRRRKPQAPSCAISDPRWSPRAEALPNVGEIGLDRIAAAHDAVSDQYARTPSLRIPAVDDLLGCPVRLKAESLQPSGSFKLRGVSSKLHSLGDEAERGVVAGTAGNHGRALAYAAMRRGVPCELFVPLDAPISKTEPAAELGAKLTRCEGTVDDCVERARERADEGGLAFCHPFDDADVIAGQGSVGLELLDQVPELSRVLVPLGGGGLACGIAIAIRSQRPEVEVIGVQVESCPSFPESIEAGEPVTVVPRTTVADGIAVKRPGS